MIFSPDFFPESDYSQNFRPNRFCTLITWIPKYCNNTIKREKKTPLFNYNPKYQSLRQTSKMTLKGKKYFIIYSKWELEVSHPF